VNLARFGVTKPVPVNLLLMAILIAGVVSLFTITREFFPEVTPEMASITLPYPGATPQEVEEGMALKVEEAIDDLDEVDEIRTTLAEGGGGVTVEFRSGVNIDKAVDEIEREIDALTDLPEEAEEIQVVAIEPRMPVIMVALYGEIPEAELKAAIHRVRDDLKTLPSMGEILVSGVRDYEIRVDVSYPDLIRHGVSLPEVAEAIGAWMAEVPGGSVRTETGNINVRTLGVPERASAIRDIVVKAAPGGGAIRVRDIATVEESFVDQQLERRFNGEPAASLTVFKVGDQDAVEMAEMVRSYVDGRMGKPYQGSLGEHLIETNLGIKSKQRLAYERGAAARDQDPLPGELATYSDLARFIEGRLDLLTRNALWGAMLVFATLLFFLNWRVAFWVGVGLVAALSGTLFMMWATGVTLNLLTMFGLIVVLGLLVDDAIVVAENIQARHDRNEPALVAAINGTNQVFWPVVATVITTIVAFLPLSFIEGQIGDLLGALPIVVACALTMSLLESVLILPSHMGHSLKHRDKKEPKRAANLLHRFEAWRDRMILERLTPAFGRLLDLSLRFRYVSVAIALAVLLGSAGLMAGGRVDFTFLSSSDSETLIVDIRMPVGTPIDRTRRVVLAIENAALAQNRGDANEVKSVGSLVGEQQDVERGTQEIAATHVAQVFIELTPVEQRTRESTEIIDSIRQASKGEVKAAESIRYSEVSGGPGGPDITLEVTGEDLATIEAAVAEIKGELSRIPGVTDIMDDSYPGQREMQINVRAGGRALGFNNQIVAAQVRAALFGAEAHVFSAKREDIDVRVRLDEGTRRSLYAIENMWVVSPAGIAVPLVEVAEITWGSSYSTVKRIDRRRAVTVTADTDPQTNPERVMAAFPLEEIRSGHALVSIEKGGRQENLREAMSTLPYGFAAALVMIYVILAWLFSSYMQPIAVMLAIPFGIIGVIWGHFLMGYTMTFLSLIGFVALSGIVVNDSLILVQFYNTLRAEHGSSVRDALVQAGMRRLRPISLTTVTTVLGLTPLMLEQSFQARFLIPMAIAVSFGLMSATVLILMVLPCFIVIMDDFKAVAYYLWHGRPRSADPRPAATDLAALPE